VNHSNTGRGRRIRDKAFRRLEKSDTLLLLYLMGGLTVGSTVRDLAWWLSGRLSAPRRRAETPPDSLRRFDAAEQKDVP
jgi:hypothetical protein